MLDKQLVRRSYSIAANTQLNGNESIVDLATLLRVGCDLPARRRTGSPINTRPQLVDTNSPLPVLFEGKLSPKPDCGGIMRSQQDYCREQVLIARISGFFDSVPIYAFNFLSPLTIWKNISPRNCSAHSRPPDSRRSALAQGRARNTFHLAAIS